MESKGYYYGVFKVFICDATPASSISELLGKVAELEAIFPTEAYHKTHKGHVSAHVF